jgi:hypothetical protein
VAESLDNLSSRKYLERQDMLQLTAPNEIDTTLKKSAHERQLKSRGCILSLYLDQVRCLLTDVDQ